MNILDTRKAQKLLIFKVREIIPLCEIYVKLAKQFHYLDRKAISFIINSMRKCMYG